MPLTPGTRLGAYEIIAAIGAGGMGEVYRARDTTLNRDVALKILPEAFAADPDRLARFRREAQVLAALNHPSIAHIHEMTSGVFSARAGSEKTPDVISHALVMELVEGEDLSAHIARGPLPSADALAIARQIADALEAAHEEGIIHRDLKPANVKVRDDGTVKVLDFGLAKAKGPGTSGPQDSVNSPTMLSPAMTEIGMILGTASYMSPEQAKGRVVDKRADIWAFGVVLYEMLTGRSMFDGDSVAETIGFVATRDPDWTALPASTPASVRRLLARCLTRDPKHRLRDIGEARIALASADEPASEPARPRRAGPRRAWVLAIGALAVVASGAFGWWVSNRSRPAGPPIATVHAQMSATPAASANSRRSLQSMAFTPDGRTLVFSDQRAGSLQLYRRELDQDDALPIAGTEGGAAPFVSPDGLWVGFLVDGALKKVPIGGGTAETIHDLRKTAAADAIAMGWANELGGVGDLAFGATWLPDQTIVYGRFSGGLWQVPASGGEPKPLTSTETGAEFAHRLPHALPGGRAVIFTVQSGVFGGGSIDAVDLASHKRTRLVEDGSDARFVGPGHLIFARQGALYAIRFDPATLRTDGDAVRIVPDVMHGVGGNSPGAATGAAQFDMSTEGTLVFLPGGTVPMPLSQIAWVSKGKPAESLGVEPMSYLAPKVSPDGSQIAVMGIRQGESDNTLYRIDTARGILTPVFKGATFALWAPDGSRLIAAWREANTGRQSIASIALSGAQPDRLVESPHLLWPGSVSKDGKWLAYVESNPTTGNDIWIAGLTPNVAPRALLNTPANESHPAFSFDGRWLAYTVREADGDAVYVLPFPGPGRPERISKEAGRAPVWAPDGKALYYISRDTSRILVVDVDTAGPMIRIGRTEVFAEGRFNWSTPVGGFDVALDGRRLLVTIPVRRAAAAGASAVVDPSPLMLRIIINAGSLLAGGK